MPATVLTVPPDHTSAATFRAYGLAISNAIAAAGWVKTADTGQIDWATVANPGTNTVAGYEIWRMADSLQATRPVFMKVEYGRNQQGGPGIWLTVGTATDGAGTLSASGSFPGTLFNRVQVHDSSYSTFSSATASESLVVGDTSELVVSMHWHEPDVMRGLGWTVGRTRDWAGAPVGDGFYVCWWSGRGTGSYPNNVWTQRSFKATAYNDTSNALGMVHTAVPSTPSLVDGSDVHLLPMLTGYHPDMKGPAKWLCFMGMADAAHKTRLTGVSHLGETCTFVAEAGPTSPYGINPGYAAMGRTNPVYLEPAIRIA